MGDKTNTSGILVLGYPEPLDEGQTRGHPFLIFQVAGSEKVEEVVLFGLDPIGEELPRDKGVQHHANRVAKDHLEQKKVNV